MLCFMCLELAKTIINVSKSALKAVCSWGRHMVNKNYKLTMPFHLIIPFLGLNAKIQTSLQWFKKKRQRKKGIRKEKGILSHQDEVENIHMTAATAFPLQRRHTAWGKEHKLCHRKWLICCGGISHWKFWKFSVLLILFVQFFKKSTFKSNTVIEVKSKSRFAHKKLSNGASTWKSPFRAPGFPKPSSSGLAADKITTQVTQGDTRRKLENHLFLLLRFTQGKTWNSEFWFLKGTQPVSKQTGPEASYGS